MIEDYEEADYQAEQDERSRSEYEAQQAELHTKGNRAMTEEQLKLFKTALEHIKKGDYTTINSSGNKIYLDVNIFFKNLEYLAEELSKSQNQETDINSEEDGFYHCENNAEELEIHPFTPDLVPLLRLTSTDTWSNSRHIFLLEVLEVEKMASFLSNELKRIKATMPTFSELEKPVGSFIGESGIKGIRTPDGTYYHYQDVCSLLKGYAMQIKQEDDPTDKKTGH